MSLSHFTRSAHGSKIGSKRMGTTMGSTREEEFQPPGYPSVRCVLISTSGVLGSCEPLAGVGNRSNCRHQPPVVRVKTTSPTSVVATLTCVVVLSFGVRYGSCLINAVQREIMLLCFTAELKGDTCACPPKSSLSKKRDLRFAICDLPFEK